MGNNFKFYTENRLDSNATYTFSDAVAEIESYLFDNNYNTKLVSASASDLTTVTYTVAFASVKVADRLLIASNFKDFDIQYSDDNQSTWKDFSTAINETANTASFNYYEFDEVDDITDLRVRADKTITANQEKELAQLRLMSQLGEVSANPYNMENPYDERSAIHNKSDGGTVYVQFGRKMHMTIDFDDASNDDVTLFRTLKDRFAPFFVYPNGGLSTYTQEPFRVQDMYFVNYINPFHPRLRNGFLIDAGTEITLEMMEV